MDEIDTNEVIRASYLHEAGHAVVAVELGMVVRAVVCDGETGHVEADWSDTTKSAVFSLFRARDAGQIDGERLLRQGIETNRAQLAVFMGGLAGESLSHAGRPITSVARAADDSTAFFSYLNAVTRNLHVPQYAPVWQEAFVVAQGTAWDIVRAKEPAVRRVAEVLESSGGQLSGDVLLAILGSLPQTKANPNA